MENWTDQLLGVVTPAVRVVQAVSRVPAQVQLMLPAWDHREIYSSI